MVTNSLNKKAKLNRFVIVVSIILVGLLVIFFFVIIYNQRDQKDDKSLIKPDLYLSFDDRSRKKENPSIVVFIDENEIIRLDSLSLYKNKTVQLKLDSGLHSINARTIDGRLKLNDSFRIKYPDVPYRLCIMFYSDSLHKRFEILFHDLLLE